MKKVDMARGGKTALHRYFKRNSDSIGCGWSCFWIFCAVS